MPAAVRWRTSTSPTPVRWRPSWPRSARSSGSSRPRTATSSSPTSTAHHQAVIGGATEAVEQAIAKFTEAGYTALRIPVSMAFHTSIVAPVSEPLRRQLARLGLRPPTLPIVANVTGEFYPRHRSRRDRVDARHPRPPGRLAGPVRQGPADPVRRRGAGIRRGRAEEGTAGLRRRRARRRTRTSSRCSPTTRSSATSRPSTPRCAACTRSAWATAAARGASASTSGQAPASAVPRWRKARHRWQRQRQQRPASPAVPLARQPQCKPRTCARKRGSASVTPGSNHVRRPIRRAWPPGRGSARPRSPHPRRHRPITGARAISFARPVPVARHRP